MARNRALCSTRRYVSLGSGRTHHCEQVCSETPVVAHLSLSQDFDFGIMDMAEGPADGHGDTVSNDTDPVSTKGLIANAMARQSANPSLVDSAAVDKGVVGHIVPERDVDPFGFNGRTLVSSYVPLICVLLAGVAWLPNNLQASGGFDARRTWRVFSWLGRV